MKRRNPAVLHIIRHQKRWQNMKSLALLLLITLISSASPAVGQERTFPAGDGCNTCRDDGSGFASCTLMACLDASPYSEPAIEQEPSRDARLLDFYRELVAGKNREIFAKDREIAALQTAIEERNKTIASLQATIQANRSSGKMTRGDWAKLGLAIAGPVISVIVARGE